MPSIVVKKSDLARLIGRGDHNWELNEAELEDYLCLVKGELKRSEGSADDLKIELNDTNRPDTWCVEGIARQIKYALGQGKATNNSPRDLSGSDFFESPSKYSLEAKSSVSSIRPVVGAFVCRNLEITEYLLEQIIQSQEKLCENFGSKRRSVAIGVYNLENIVFPVVYSAVEPQSHKFVPLGYDTEMDLDEILREHPKGKQYGALVSSFDRYPLLQDSRGSILSFPPIINSRLVGEVSQSSRSLFIEATGDDLQKVTLALNILAYNLADRGGIIERVNVKYECPYQGQSEIVFPMRLQNEMSVKHQLFEQLIGESIESSQIKHWLNLYGCTVSTQGDDYLVKTEEYRADYLHPTDVVEDWAIARGYNSFSPDTSSCFTIGGLARSTEFADKARSILVGLGFEEIFLNMLMNKEEIVTKTLMPGSIVEIENIMTENYGVVRNSLIPGLMKVESTSADALYPHRLFEVGEVALVDPLDNQGSKTVQRAAFLIAHPKASFSEVHSCLENFLYYLGYECKLEHCEEPWLIPGRSGKIVIAGVDCGRIGELHPNVLFNWDIGVPVAVCEVDLYRLQN